MVSSGLLRILVISILLENVQGFSLADLLSPKRCPRIREECQFKERDECSKNKTCPDKKKCCVFSCGKKCLDLHQGWKSKVKCRQGHWSYWIRDAPYSSITQLRFQIGSHSEIYAVCRKILVSAWPIFVAGGIIRKMIPVPSSSMVAAKETETTSKPKTCVRIFAPKNASNPECIRINRNTTRIGLMIQGSVCVPDRHSKLASSVPLPTFQGLSPSQDGTPESASPLFHFNLFSYKISCFDPIPTVQLLATPLYTCVAPSFPQ